MSRGSLWPAAIKSLIFIVVTTMVTLVLASTIRAGGSGGDRYTAMFENVVSLNVGDDVRVAGVRVGRVESIDIDQQRLARVEFSVDENVAVGEGAVVALRFRNLVGQRYVALQQPADLNAPAIEPGTTFELAQTQPALDLTMLFNGFQPLFQLLSPEDVNELSFQIVRVFQGEGATVEGLLEQTASLSSTVAEKDEVIGSVIDNLTVVLETLNDRSGELSQLITTLRTLVSGLAQDREVIGDTLDGLGALTVEVADLAERGREPLRQSIDELGGLSATLADNGSTLESFLQNLPTKLDAVGRLTGYGSWVNLYLCEISGEIAVPEGYRGDVGVVPNAERCQA